MEYVVAGATLHSWSIVDSRSFQVKDLAYTELVCGLRWLERQHSLNCLRASEAADKGADSAPVGYSWKVDTLFLSCREVNFLLDLRESDVELILFIMAVLSSSILVSSVSLVHLTVAYFLYTAPVSITRHGMVLVLGSAFELVSLAFIYRNTDQMNRSSEPELNGAGYL